MQIVLILFFPFCFRLIEKKAYPTQQGGGYPTQQTGGYPTQPVVPQQAYTSYAAPPGAAPPGAAPPGAMGGYAAPPPPYAPPGQVK